LGQERKEEENGPRKKLRKEKEEEMNWAGRKRKVKWA
jgi:hypothetical protein